MLKKVEVLIDDDLLQEVIHRYHLADAREAIGLALRTLLSEGDEADDGEQDDEYDEFSDLSVWEPHHRSDTG
jgi:Arc/MetJ family transcription regulator